MSGVCILYQRYNLQHSTLRAGRPHHNAFLFLHRPACILESPAQYWVGDFILSLLFFFSQLYLRVTGTVLSWRRRRFLPSIVFFESPNMSVTLLGSPLKPRHLASRISFALSKTKLKYAPRTSRIPEGFMMILILTCVLFIRSTFHQESFICA